jgi:hypothetical protein
VKFHAYRTDELAPHMQRELNTLLRALANRYGAAAVEVATHIENMAQMCHLVEQNLALTGDDKARALEHVNTTCLNALNLIGAALRVSKRDAYACAKALAEHTRHMEAEILGEAIEPGAEAAAVIAKAAA